MNEKTSKIPKSVLVIEVPKRFPYTSKKTVPWDYHYNYANETAATDLIGVGGITRSGCIYLPTITNKVAAEKPATPAEKEQLLEDGSTFRKESQPIKEKEACEFLKFVKHSKYSVVE